MSPNEPAAPAHPWTGDLLDYYAFVDASRHALRAGVVEGPARELVDALDAVLSVAKTSPTGSRYREAKFDGAYHRDGARLAVLRDFVARYPLADLVRYRELVELEVDGLEKDLRPRSLITGSLVGVVFLALSLAVAWSALWSGYFGLDLAQVVADTLIEKLGDSGVVRGILSVVMVLGGFVGIGWFATAVYHNEKQIGHLHSLRRALALYLVLESPQHAGDAGGRSGGGRG